MFDKDAGVIGMLLGAISGVIVSFILGWIP